MDKILYIPHRNINAYGSGQRTDLLMRALCEKYQVDVVLPFEKDEVPDSPNENCNFLFYKYLPPVRKKKSIWQIEFYFPKDEYYENICKELISKVEYKYVVVRYLDNVFLYGLENEKNLIVDIDDNPPEKLKTLNRHKLKKRFNYFVKYQILNYYVNRFVKNKPLHSFFSNSEQAVFTNSSSLPNIPYPFLKNVAIEPVPINERKQNIIFVGFMRYLPNYQGIEYFITHVWEKIKKQVPDAELKIIGKEMPDKLQDYISSFSDVKYLGFVEDLYAEYSHCKAIIIPIYSGAGTNIKMLEGMKTGRPCIISKFASRGFQQDLVDGENVLIAKDDDDFAEKVVKILVDNDLNEKIGEKGKTTIEKKYSFDYFKNCIYKNLKI